MAQQIANLPPLSWLQEPLEFSVTGNSLSIIAPGKTDWFVDPNGNPATTNAPALLFEVENDCMLSARVDVAFGQTYDAGVLAFYQHPTSWAKLCFERSPQGHNMIVSVVTKGTSDDCNSLSVAGNTVKLRIARMADALAFHFSGEDGYWHMVRYFALEADTALRAGFLAQSPTGQSCRVEFLNITFAYETLKDVRSGE